MDVPAALSRLYETKVTPTTPGGVLAVLRNGLVEHLGVHGRANVEFSVPWTPDTRYGIASITKTMVAELLLTLQDARRLVLDQSIRDRLPELPPVFERISLRHLLAMSSGLRHDEVLAGLLGSGPNWSNASLMPLMTRAPDLQFEPGTFQIYCCGGYRLLALAIERLLGISFPEAMRRWVFDRYEMVDCTAYPEMNRMEARLASCYAPMADGGFQRVHETGESSGDGAVVASMADLLRFLTGLTAQPGGAVPRIARLASGAPRLKGLAARYGLGLMIDRWRGRDVWAHGGSSNTYFAHLPGEALTIACFNNHRGIDARATAYAAAAILVGDAAPDEPADFDELVGWYANASNGFICQLLRRDGIASVRVLGERATPLVQDQAETIDSAGNAAPLRLTVAAAKLKGRRALQVREWLPADFDIVEAEVVSLSPTRLAAYVGRYVSHALGAMHTVEFDGVRLIMRLGAGLTEEMVLPLAPIAGDLFHHDGTSARFRRGGDGGVDALILSRLRARDVVFERLP